MLIPIPGIGAGALVGIYANLIEFVAVLDSTPTCALRGREWFDLNVGAYARLDVVVDFKTIGAIPTISTTLLNSPTLTQCWIERSPHETSGPLPTSDVSGRPPSVHPTLSLPGGQGSGSSRTVISTVILPTGTGSGSPGVTTLSIATPSGSKNPSANATSLADGSLVTSTVYSTTVYTVTSCAAGVINCPASWQKEIVVTKTVDAFTTVCPPGVVVTFPTTTKAPTPTSSVVAAAAVEVITEVIILSTCPTPIVETFVAPTTVAPPSQHHITVVIPAPTTATLPVVLAVAIADNKNLWSNSTATYAAPTTAKPSAGGVSTSPARPAFTAGASRPFFGGCAAAAAAVVGLWFAM
jgi:hypothetical protein